MRNLSILVDMDDVLNNLTDTWIEMINQENGTDVRIEQINNWEIGKYFPSLPEKLIRSYLERDDLWERVKVKEEELAVLQQLREDGHEIGIATNTGYKEMYMKMSRFLDCSEKYGISWNDIIVIRHKQRLKTDVLIDDGVFNLIGGEFLKVLVNKPYNREFDINNERRLMRVDNLSEAYELLSIIAGKR